MDDQDSFETTAALWSWRTAKASTVWHFVTITGQVSAEIRFAALGRTGGFGSIKVEAQIGDTVWRTSLFPHRESGGFLLPIKASVRKAEGISEGDSVAIELRL